MGFFELVDADARHYGFFPVDVSYYVYEVDEMEDVYYLKVVLESGLEIEVYDEDEIERFFLAVGV